MHLFNKILIGLLVCYSIPCYAQAILSPEKETLKLFNRYKPVIEKKNDGIVEDPQVFTADINGDGLPDCILSFVMTPKEGGNLMFGHECVIYLNTGKGMKVAGAFPNFKFCYSVDHIKNMIIYIKQYECAPPYNNFIKNSKLVYRNGKIVELR